MKKSVNMNIKSLENKYQEIDNTFDDLFKELDNNFDIDAKVIASRFLNEVKDIAEVRKINRKKLAEMIGTSPSYLTQLYRGTKIMNLVTMAKLKKALDLEVEIKITNNIYAFEVEENKFEKFYSIHQCTHNNILWGVIKNFNNDSSTDNDKYVSTDNATANSKIKFA